MIIVVSNSEAIKCEMYLLINAVMTHVTLISLKTMETYGVTPEWGCNLFWSGSALMPTFCVNGPCFHSRTCQENILIGQMAYSHCMGPGPGPEQVQGTGPA